MHTKKFKKKYSQKNFPENIFQEKNVHKKISQKKSAEKSWKKWARRAPLVAAEGCSSPQELEKAAIFLVEINDLKI